MIKHDFKSTCSDGQTINLSGVQLFLYGGDSCDDCFVGTDDLGPLADNDPANDGADFDGDGQCDAGDTDDDDDGDPDTSDCAPLDPLIFTGQTGAVRWAVRFR